MKNLVIVTVEVKQFAAIAVIGEASSSKRQWSRCSRLRRRVAVAAMAWFCEVASPICWLLLHAIAVWRLAVSDFRALCVWCELLV